nr:hypothetical protein [Lachnospiraceae bacterium]
AFTEEEIVYGIGKEKDILLSMSGESTYALYKVIIAGMDLNIEKTIEENGYFYLSADFEEDSMVIDKAVVNMDGDGYLYGGKEYVRTIVAEKEEVVSIVARVTDLMYDEYYITLPSSFVMKKTPEKEEVLFAVNKKNTTSVINKTDRKEDYYVVYSFGEIVGVYNDIAKAISKATLKNIAGTVVNSEGKVFWERGIKAPSFYIENYPATPADEDTTARAAVADMILKINNINDVSVKRLSDSYGVYKFLGENTEGTGITIIDVSGLSLDDVLYFVNRGSIVYAMKDRYNAIAITGYNVNGITYYDPAEEKRFTITYEEAETLFSVSENTFLTYMQ